MAFELSRNLRQDKQRREDAAYSKEQLSRTKAIAEAVVGGMIPVITKAIQGMNVDVPKAEVKVNIPPVRVILPDMPEIEIPEIKVPEAKVTVKLPEMPEIKTPKIPPVKVPKPEVTVNVPPIKVPKQEPPIVNIPDSVRLKGIDKSNPLPTMMVDTKGQPISFGQSGGKSVGSQKIGLNLPEFDEATLTETPETDTWKLEKGGRLAAQVLIKYEDDLRGTISTVTRTS